MARRPINMEQLLSDNRIPFITGGQHKRVGKSWIGIHCPFCVGKQDYHLGFNKDSQAWSCWRCGKHYTFDVLHKLLNLTDNKIYQLIKQYQDRPQRRREPEIKERASSLYMPGEPLDNVGAARIYIEGRGFNPDKIIKLYGVKATGPVGNYKHRIMIPIFYKGRIVSYQGRDITGKAELKYKACSEPEEIIHHKHIVYNYDSAEKITIVVEGILDAWRIGEGCVATFGVGYTTKQTQLLAMFKKVFILFDLDEDAQTRADHLAYHLQAMGTRAYIISDLLNEGEDPAMLKKDEVRVLRKEIGLD